MLLQYIMFEIATHCNELYWKLQNFPESPGREFKLCSFLTTMEGQVPPLVTVILRHRPLFSLPYDCRFVAPVFKEVGTAPIREISSPQSTQPQPSAGASLEKRFLDTVQLNKHLLPPLRPSL